MYNLNRSPGGADNIWIWYSSSCLIWLNHFKMFELDINCWLSMINLISYPNHTISISYHAIIPFHTCPYHTISNHTFQFHHAISYLPISSHFIPAQPTFNKTAAVRSTRRIISLIFSPNWSFIKILSNVKWFWMYYIK